MGFLNIALIALVLLQVHAISGGRLLHEETKKLVNEGLDLQSLQRGSVPPSEGSSCTNIPGNGGPGCPLKEMHFAAVAVTLPRPDAYPRLMAQFGVASDQK